MSVPPDGTAPAAPLQFDSVQPLGAAPTSVTCANCKASIADVYHQVNHHVVCTRCRSLLEQKFVAGEGTAAGRFGKAALLGVGGGIAGAVVYGLVLLTDWQFGPLAVLIGYLVGKGVRKGSGGRGGWRYQGLAMVITYFAVSFAYLPAIIKDARDEAHTPAAAAPAGDASAPAASAPAANASPSASSADKGTAARDGKGDSGGGALFGALMLAVSLPVLMIVGGSWFTALMLAIALYQAWQTNIPAKFAFAGPFRVARPAPAPAEA